MGTHDIRKLKRLRTIHRSVQVVATLLLVIIGIQFQGSLGFTLFVRTVAIAILFQLLLFYPLKKAAEKEVDREVESAREWLSDSELATLRNRRLVADVIKMAVYMFFLVAIFLLPDRLAAYRTANHAILSTTIYTFLLTTIAWSQYLTWHLTRRIISLS